MTTWIMTRYDLPFKSMQEIEKLDNPEIRQSVLNSPPPYLLKDPKMLALAGASMIQFICLLDKPYCLPLSIYVTT